MRCAACASAACPRVRVSNNTVFVLVGLPVEVLLRQEQRREVEAENSRRARESDNNRDVELKKHDVELRKIEFQEKQLELLSKHATFSVDLWTSSRMFAGASPAPAPDERASAGNPVASEAQGRAAPEEGSPVRQRATQDANDPLPQPAKRRCITCRQVYTIVEEDTRRLAKTQRDRYAAGEICYTCILLGKRSKSTEAKRTPARYLKRFVCQKSNHDKLR